MRSLNGLLALSLRWLELVRSLRSLLSSAEAAGHKAGQAFAHHELGSLHLCVGQAETAREHLDEALRIEEQMGDLAGRCATRHNLDAARRELAGRPGGVRPPRRLLRLAVLAAVFVGLAAGAGGTSIAFAIRGGGDGSASAPGDRSSVAFTVGQDFEPDNPRALGQRLGQLHRRRHARRRSKPASETAPAIFAISGFGAGATCTATFRAAPAGYTIDVERLPERLDHRQRLSVLHDHQHAQSDRLGDLHRHEGLRAGQPGLGQRLGQLHERAAVPTHRRSPRGRARRPSSRSAASAPARPARLREGAAPAGYTSSERGCRDVAIASGKPAACTIINTREHACLGHLHGHEGLRARRAGSLGQHLG